MSSEAVVVRCVVECGHGWSVVSLRGKHFVVQVENWLLQRWFKPMVLSGQYSWL